MLHDRFAMYDRVVRDYQNTSHASVIPKNYCLLVLPRVTLPSLSPVTGPLGLQPRQGLVQS